VSDETVSEREKWLAELDAKKRELDIKEREQATREADLDLRKKELASSTWRNPLTVAVFAAAAAAAGNAVVTVVNGNLQRDLEERKRTAEINLERSKAESIRILEMIKTGDTEKAAGNLAFLLESGLVNEPLLTKKLGNYLKSREPGSGPSLPATGRVEFEKSSVLSQPLQGKLQALLDSYFIYLEKIGFPASGSQVKVKIVDDRVVNAYYVNNSMVIHRQLADDPSVALREYNHHILDADKHGWRSNIVAIESGLADYFACSFLDSPLLGGKSAKAFGQDLQYIRNLANEKRFEELLKVGETQYPYLGAEVWGGAFWTLREKLGHDVADAVLASAWRKFTIPPQDADIARSFVQAVLDEVKRQAPGPDSLAIAMAQFRERGFPMSANPK
jgi:hypothetical protein